MPGSYQMSAYLTVTFYSCGLVDDLSIPVDGEPFQAPQNQLGKVSLRTLKVRILNPEEELSTRVMGKEIVE
jgi:hypothetical protein